MKREFIRGTVYMVRPKLGKEIIKQDLKNIAEAGFNIVTIWPALYWNEKKKQPDFTFIDFVVEEFDKLSVKVVIELMGQYSAMEYAPDWMVKNDLLIKDFDGNRYKTNVHDLNFNHPEVKKMIFDYIDIVVKHFKNKKNVCGYDIYNEHHFESFDKYTMKKFKNWLEEKYKTITKLNEVWSRTFSSFDEVTLELRFWHSIKSRVDWEMFKYHNLAMNLRDWTKKLKSIDSKKPVIADNELAMVIYDKRDAKYVDDWSTAKEVDLYGTTWYPKSSPKNEAWLWSLMFDFFRSTTKGKDYLLSELQTNNYSATRNRGVSNKNDIKIWMWRAVGFNAKGITFWKWAPFVKAQQLGGRGLVNIDRKLSERAYAAKEVNLLLKKYESIFMNSQIINPPVCIYYDRENKKFVDALVDLGNKKDVAHIADLSIYGWYKALYDNGIHAEFINEDEFNLGMAEKYKIMIIPFNFIINKEVASKIKNFVKQGGIVIGEFRLGLSETDEFTYLTIPGEGLDKVFGFKEYEMLPMGEDFIKTNILNTKISTGYYRQDIIVYDKTEIIGMFAKNNKPAIIKNKFGKGCAYYFAASVGYGYNQNNNEGFKLFLKDIISPIVKSNYILTVLDNPLNFDNILHKSGNIYILYVFNFEKEKSNETIRLHCSDKVKIIKDITNNKSQEFETIDNTNDILINIGLEAYSNKVLFIYF